MGKDKAFEEEPKTGDDMQEAGFEEVTLPQHLRPVASIGPIVSSAHLAEGGSPGMSEVEYGLILASHAFSRWMVRCMAAAGLPGLSPIEVLILHSTRHRDREKK